MVSVVVRGFVAGWSRNKFFVGVERDAAEDSRCLIKS